MTIGNEPRIFHLVTPVQPDMILLTFLSTLFEAEEMNDKEGFKFRLTPLKAEN